MMVVAGRDAVGLGCQICLRGQVIQATDHSVFFCGSLCMFSFGTFLRSYLPCCGVQLGVNTCVGTRTKQQSAVDTILIIIYTGLVGARTAGLVGQVGREVIYSREVAWPLPLLGSGGGNGDTDIYSLHSDA